MSVIVPLYNAERYISDCLNSLLTQTFQNFEVIVVDDCSTDSSCAIVESYREKFDGRLTLSHMDKNSGSGALPRNKGLNLSRGEYVYFMDADDFVTKTALEELYMLAKDYNADVVYCEKFYRADDDGKNLKIMAYQLGGFVDKPTLEPDDLAERVQRILGERYWVTPWCKLVRRNLMIEHENFFPQICICEDNIWTYSLVFYAKKFLRVPNVTYIYRIAKSSMTSRKKTPQQTINFWLNPILLGLKALNQLMLKHEFFQKNSSYRYAVLENFSNANFRAIFKDSLKLPPFAVYETIEQEFGAKLGEQDVLIAALCTALNTQQKNNAANIQQFQQFAAQAQARIAQLEAELKRR